MPYTVSVGNITIPPFFIIWTVSLIPFLSQFTFNNFHIFFVLLSFTFEYLFSGVDILSVNMSDPPQNFDNNDFEDDFEDEFEESED